jgi:hypothetical protein
MKTKIQIIAIALAGGVLWGCSSSLQMSRSSGSKTDDIYYAPGQKTEVKTDQVAENTSLKRNSSADLNLSDLEKKYADILAKDTTGKVDTVVYKAENKENHYEKVLSNSYQESYERRLRAQQDGYFGLGGGFNNYNDYWYASAYDPSFYNVIVVGSSVWVEPYYISAMFGWPSYGFYGYNNWPYYGYYRPWGFGLGFNYGYPYYGYGWGGYWGWNSYAWGYNSGFWNGYYWGNYYGNNYNDNVYYHGSYGSRPNSNGAVVAGSRPTVGAVAGINDRQRDMADKQVVLSTQEPVTAVQRPVRETNGNDEARKPNTLTRPSRESLNINPTRIVDQNRQYTRTEPTRESYNPSYTKPKPANSNEFNRPARTNYPQTDAVKGSESSRQPAIATPQRGGSTRPERTYNPPPRTAAPVGTSNRESGSRNDGGSRVSPSNSGSSSSGSSSRGSSGSSSSGSSSRGSSSSNGSSSNNNVRKR